MSHPYTSAPPPRFWRSAVSEQGSLTDPVVHFPFRIQTSHQVMTAGSCFAQHISGRLAASGYGFLVTETAHPLVAPEVASAFNYGRFTARFGNIYSARQLLQLIRRAYGRFSPTEDIWISDDGSCFDPYRPQIQPGGFASEEEYRLDRLQHFAAVRTAFETLDVLIFTLGLTEIWESVSDGAVFPVCPGAAAGSFDPEAHRFRNQDVNEVVNDLQAFLRELHDVNPDARLILTVSPVPLVATAEDVHVLTANTYSKAVLRVAAETITRQHPSTAYFPSFEIVTGPHARGSYFDTDLRSVTEAGVDRVMELFFRHVMSGPGEEHGATSPAPSESEQFLERSGALMDVMCDEESLVPTERVRASEL